MSNKEDIGLVLVVDARVRYWEDAIVNGVEDVGGLLIPSRQGDSWCPVIDLSTGTIIGWPTGTTADVHYKVCDDGDYWLADADGTQHMKWRGDYVPDKFLCHGDNGYGDYIILNIDEHGHIANWTNPRIYYREWVQV